MVDVKSDIARVEPGTAPPQPYAESQIEYLAWFRFPITWSFINEAEFETDSKVAPRPLSAPAPLSLAPALPGPVPTGPVLLNSAGVDEQLQAAVSPARWEMMVPKMARPVARPVVNLERAAPAALDAPTPEAAQAPAPAIPPVTESAPSELVAPALSFHAHESRFMLRQWSNIGFAAVAVAAIGSLMWGLSSQSAPSATSPPVKTINWAHEPGAPSGRTLTVYEPSRGESNYRMEFNWVPDATGVGWVFRTRDGNNYYAARLSLQPRATKSVVKAGVLTAGVLVAEHFSVFGGAESAHSRKVIPLGSAAGLVRVHMDAIGPAFKLFVEDNPADSWTDARFNSGALGFYDDGDHLPKLLALNFTLIDKAVSRTALVSLP